MGLELRIAFGHVVRQRRMDIALTQEELGFEAELRRTYKYYRVGATTAIAKHHFQTDQGASAFTRATHGSGGGSVVPMPAARFPHRFRLLAHSTTTRAFGTSGNGPKIPYIGNAI